eukprot:SAG11_NODE_5525_length_1535_cov_1.442201_2_plen_158_part_00
MHYVNAGKLIVREGFSEESRQLGSMVKGQQVEVLVARSAMGKIRARTNEGWVTATTNLGKPLLESDVDLQGLTADSVREQIIRRDAEVVGAPRPSLNSNTEEPSCVVCLETFAPGVAALQLPICKHTFCRGCITKWFRMSKACPMCRVELREDEVRR